LRGKRDRSRAEIELREALAAAQRYDNLAAEASASVDLGVTLGAHSPGESARYIDYGLAVARKVLGRNEFAMLALGAQPSREIVEEVGALHGLANRAHMALDLAQTKLLFHDGEYRAAIERAEALAEVLERSGLHASSREATIIEAAARKLLRGKRRSGAWRLTPDLAALAGEIL
jgi:hypothetical protein